MAATKDAALMALRPFNRAAQKLMKAAEESADAAKKSRARVRRQRIISQTVAGVTIPPPEPINMPNEWADDEVTTRLALPSELKTRT
jgi:hypothetical protein